MSVSDCLPPDQDPAFTEADDILCLLDADGRLRAVNPAFVKAVGRAAAEALGQPLAGWIHAAERDRFDAALGALTSGRAWGGAVCLPARIEGADGGFVPLAWTFARASDGVRGRAGPDPDVAERARLERELEEMRRAHAASAEVLDAASVASRARSSFLSNMSHELRTPLNGILGYAQLMALDASLSDKHREGLDAIRRSGEQLLVLINDMLDLARMEAGTLDSIPSEFLLAEFLAGVVEMFEHRARGKRLAFGYDALTELPAAIRCDETRLRQALVNLVSHAIRHCEQGGVFVTAGFADGALRVRVEEASRGSSSAQAESFFAPLSEQGADGTPVAGTVLELPARLVRSLDGSFVIERRGEEGSVFWVEFEPEVVSGWASRPSGQRTVAGYEGMRRTVLVVDDKRENRAVLVRMLDPLGFVVREAEDGEMAVRMVAAEPPDLILMDLVMPVLDGFEATRRIRAIAGASGVPIVAMSASSFEPEHSRSRAAGCDDYLGKPVRRDKLLAILAAHLGLTWRYRAPGEGGGGLAPVSVPLGPTTDRPQPAAESAPAAGEGELTRRQIESIYDAASIGDIRAILTIVDVARKIEAAAEERVGPPGLLDELQRLAKRFQARKIKDLLAPLLERSETTVSG
ncbi:response regulator [Haliangium sp.]|uniref:response regulator n=1 Tax=Haliangium sp. TaxID=2663208 RepID=UPI003D13BF66